MSHPSEEDLVLLRYREAVDAPVIQTHLDDCAECRARFEQLERDLTALPALDVPERGPDYPGQVWARLQRHLPARAPASVTSLPAVPRARDAAPRPHRSRLAAWGTFAALAASLLAAFWLGRQWPLPAGRPAEGSVTPVRERILLVAVGDHLERSRMVLVELVNAEGTGKVDISAEQRAATDLVEANRLYRQTATRAGEAGVADVLDDLERVLLEVATAPSAVSASELEDLRRRIEARGILFKVKVMGSQVREREKAARPGAIS
jgi:hypothetical protein